MSIPDDYFASSATPEPGAEPTYYAVDEIAEISFLEGLTFQPVLGKDLLVSFIEYDANVDVPEHSHVEEQFTWVVSGKLEMRCNGETRVLGPREVIHLPSGIAHSARSLGERCVSVDVFAPPRKVLAEYMRAQSAAS